MESENVIEVAAPSSDEAIIIGLTRMGVTRDEVDIHILDEGSRGFLGLGSREARVRLTRRAVPRETAPAPPVEPATPVSQETSAPQETLAPQETPAQAQKTPAPSAPEPEFKPKPETKPAPAAQATSTDSTEAAAPKKRSTSRKKRSGGQRSGKQGSGRQASDREEFEEQEISLPEDLDHIALEEAALDVSEHLFSGLQVKTTLRWQQEDRPTLWMSVRGRDADMLVGPRAQTLNSVQYLLRSLLHHKVDGNYNIVMDADGYRKRRNHNLESLASKVANQAVKNGRTIRMRPMPANERRIIHMILRKDDRVETESVGRGRNRAITVIPVKKSED